MHEGLHGILDGVDDLDTLFGRKKKGKHEHKHEHEKEHEKDPENDEDNHGQKDKEAR